MSSIMSSMELWIWPSMAMVLFLLVFVGVAMRVLRATKQECEHNAGLPLFDGTAPSLDHAHGTDAALAPSKKGDAR